MSTHWDLECPTHHAKAGFDWNHGAAAIAEVWRNRAPLVALAGSSIFDPHDMRYNSTFQLISWDAIEFLSTHDGCEGLELVNEYGDRRRVADEQPIPPRHCATCSCPPR